MSTVCENGCCVELEYGDRVRLVQKPEVTGQIIAERNWGEAFFVRLANALDLPVWLFNCEIELDPDVQDKSGDAATPPDTAPANDNVVHVDFRSVPAMGGVH